MQITSQQRRIVFFAVASALLASFFLAKLLGYESFSPARVYISRLLVVWVMLGVPLLKLPEQGAINRLIDFFVRPASPYGPALFRIVYFSMFGFAVLLGGNVAAGYVGEFISYSTQQRIPIPYMQWYSAAVPFNTAIAQWLFPLFNVLCVLCLFGLFTRVSMVLYVILGFYLFSIPMLYGKVFAFQHMWLFPALFCFTDCGRVWSLDALIRKYIFKKPLPEVFTVANRIPQSTGLVLLAMLYFFSGFWKLWSVGLDWATYNNIVNHLYGSWLVLPPAWQPVIRIDNYPLLLVLAAVFTVVFEFGFPFFAMSSKTRRWLPLLGIILHVGIFLLMKISFFIMFLVYTVCFDVDAIVFRKRQKPDNAYVEPPPAISYWQFVVPALFIGLSFAAGCFKIQSWPFSCYPTFDFVASPNTTSVAYTGFSSGKEYSDSLMHAYIIENRNAVNLTDVETKVKDAIAQNDTVAMRALVNTIITASPKLLTMDSIVVSLKTHPVKPEEKKHVLDIRRVGVFYP